MQKQRPTAGQTAVGQAGIMLIFIGDSLLSIPSVETEHLLRFRLSSSHPAVRIHCFLKGNDHCLCASGCRHRSVRFEERSFAQ
jgi:hypothetical protein